MSLLKSLSLMTVASIARMVGALATFSITARALGVSGYGQLMVWMSVASIIALLTNFGLSTFLLREIGAARERAREILSDAFGARLIVVSIGVVASLAGLAWVPGEHRWTFLFLLGASLAEGFTEFFNAGFRARNSFGEETRLALHTAWFYPVVVGGMAWFVDAVQWVALAYFVSRGGIAVLTMLRLHALVGDFRPVSLAHCLQCIRRSFSYSVDSALGGLFGQVDSIVLNHYIGAAGVGLHQAGMRLYLAGSSFATVLTNVFLPRAAAAHAKSAKGFNDESRVLQFTFLAVGCALGFGLSLLGPYVVPLLFGRSFEQTASLMPWFGLLFIVRFASSAWSVSFTAQGMQWMRAALTALHWIFIVVLARWLVPAYGNVGWLAALVAGNAFLIVAYVLKTWQQRGVDHWVLGCTVGAVLSYLPILVLVQSMHQP